MEIAICTLEPFKNSAKRPTKLREKDLMSDCHSINDPND